MIKELIHKVPIESIVGRDFELTKCGERYYRAVEHDSLVLDTKKNIFYWNSLGIFGSALDWLTKIKAMSISEATAVLQEYSGIPFQKNFQLLLKPSYPYHALKHAFWQVGLGCRDYWYSRGYTDETINVFMLGHTGRHYVIPVVHDGKLLNFQCILPPAPGREKRVWNWTRGLGKQPFNFGILGDTDWVILTESPVDAIIAHQFGFPAISLMPNALNWDTELTHYLYHVNTIYLMFDNDEAGRRGLRKVGAKFSDRALVVDWDGYPDKTDIGDIFKMKNAHEKMDWLMHGSLPYEALKNRTSWEWYKYYKEIDNVKR